MKYFAIALKRYFDHYRGLPLIGWQGIFLIFIESFAMGVTFFLSLFFVDVLHINITAAGALISCYGCGTIIGGLVSGLLSDKISCKKIAVFSLMIQSITYFLLTKFSSVLPLAMNLFILGIAAYAFTTSINVWILNHCRTSSHLRLKTINLSRVALNAGFGLSGMMIGLCDSTHFYFVFDTMSFSLLMATLYLIFFVNNTNEKIIPIKEKEKNIETTTPSSSQFNPSILIITLTSVFFVGLIIAQLSSTYPLYLEKIFPSLGVKAVSLLFMLDTLLIVLFQAPLVNAMKNIDKVMLLGIGAFLMGSGMLILNFSFLFLLAILSCIIWTTGEMLFIAIAQFICYESGDYNKKGKQMGIYQSIYAASKIVGPIIGSYLYYQYGGHFLWYVSFLIGAFFLFICSFSSQKKWRINVY